MRPRPDAKPCPHAQNKHTRTSPLNPRAQARGNAACVPGLTQSPARMLKINTHVHLLSTLEHQPKPPRKDGLALEHEDARDTQRAAQALVALLDGRRAHLVQHRCINVRQKPTCTRVSDPHT